MSEDTLIEVPERLFVGNDPESAEWLVRDLPIYVSDLSMTQLLRILEIVGNELEWRQEQATHPKD